MSLVLFSPPIPKGHKDNLFIDTSILRILVLTIDKDLGKAVQKEIQGITAKPFTADYAIYELKRSILAPLWTFYFLVERHQNFQLALQHYTHTFNQRELKVINQIITAMVGNATFLNVRYDLFMQQLHAIADEIEKSIQRFSKNCVSSHTGCKLHKPKFSLERDFPSMVKCETKCSVEDFWKLKEDDVKKLSAYGNSKTLSTDAKKYYEKMVGHFDGLLKNQGYGKAIRKCQSLADTILLLHAPKGKWLVLSSDHSFVQLSKATGHAVHQLISPSSYLGGSPTAVAQNQFESHKH